LMSSQRWWVWSQPVFNYLLPDVSSTDLCAWNPYGWPKSFSIV